MFQRGDFRIRKYADGTQNSPKMQFAFSLVGWSGSLNATPQLCYCGGCDLEPLTRLPFEPTFKLEHCPFAAYDNVRIQIYGHRLVGFFRILRPAQVAVPRFRLFLRKLDAGQCLRQFLAGAVFLFVGHELGDRRSILHQKECDILVPDAVHALGEVARPLV